jgi:tetratricopeptide (TPR) repeat protein
MIELATMSHAERAKNQIERLRREAAAHQSDPELALSLAGLLLDNGQVDEALATYRELLTRNADTRVWHRAGQALARAGQYELAIEFLKRAADSPEARLDLAIALAFTSGPREALEALDRVSDRERNGDYFLMKARILDSAGKEEESRKLLAEGLRLSSSRADVAQQTALWLLHRSRPLEALNVVSQAIKGHPDNAELLLSRAILLALVDRTLDAQQALKSIETRWPEWDRPYLAHGLLLERAKQVAEARQKLQIAAALGATDSILKCSVARLNGGDSNPTCACATDMRELLIRTCP